MNAHRGSSRFAGCAEGECWRSVRDEPLRRAGYDPGRFTAGPQTATRSALRPTTKTPATDPVDAIMDAGSRFPASTGWIDRTRC